MAARTPWVTLDQNGTTSFIMHFNSAAIREFKLAPEGKVSLGYDARSRRLTITKGRGGDHLLKPHGKGADAEVANRLKVAITGFYNENLEGRVQVPCRIELAKEGGAIVGRIPTAPRKTAKKKKAVTA